MQPGVPDQEPRIKTVEHQVNTAKRRLADAATLLVDGTLDRAKYEALRDQQRDVLQAVEAELTRLRSLTIVRSLRHSTRCSAKWVVGPRLCEAPMFRPSAMFWGCSSSTSARTALDGSIRAHHTVDSARRRNAALRASTCCLRQVSARPCLLNCYVRWTGDQCPIS
jgi:hypothetical protein